MGHPPHRCLGGDHFYLIRVIQLGTRARRSTGVAIAAMEQRKMQHKWRMKQLANEIERSKERTKQLEKDTELIEKETEQL